MADGGAAKIRPAAVVARLETSGANMLRKPCAAEETVLSLAPLLGALDPRNMPGPFIADGAGAGGAELSDLGGSDVVSWQISVLLSPSVWSRGNTGRGNECRDADGGLLLRQSGRKQGTWTLLGPPL